ncbi:3-dehydroquinate synthase [Paralimibaculum aggregatum]|uniref:3-dehydroquinate synthase n=1 Tax=Paralimibaculum aggregatum TaxID=3036245 RepID=A0ABQ6LEW5_9RHOB|nr:3-dehydroquinate synthase [Limibaculum sp. NKW23]GMG81887.1 3-dehydroquinate synthase [Limibaculum sp. NKW23]
MGAERVTVEVGLGDRSYRIEIGPGLLAEAGALIGPLLPRPRTVIVTDATVAALHLPALEAGLGAAGIEAHAVVLPAGEASKSMHQLAWLVERLLALEVERDDLIIAFGGGVIGDLAGFAAAVLRRGVDFVQIPTTLLAQVDSSVGGKTGVNAPQGKNLIGAFHQPRLVLADISVLETLSGRELLAGYAEVAKYGLLGDAGFFAWLEANGPGLRDGDAVLRAEAVRRSCAMKAAIVGRDERERGERALLNLGHTFGHALEAATGYSARLLHGEGVAVGTGLAFAASARMGLCPQEAPSRVAAHFADMGMVRRLADIPGELPDAEGLIRLMGQDKKVRQGRLAFILARDIGEAFLTREADMEAIRAVLAEALAERG